VIVNCGIGHYIVGGWIRGAEIEPCRVTRWRTAPWRSAVASFGRCADPRAEIFLDPLVGLNKLGGDVHGQQDVEAGSLL